MAVALEMAGDSTISERRIIGLRKVVSVLKWGRRGDEEVEEQLLNSVFPFFSIAGKGQRMITRG